MSKCVKIHTKDTLDANDLYQFLQNVVEGIEGEQRAENGYYFYIDEKSIRGVDFWKENYGYEIRMTILSNYYDYKIVKAILLYINTFHSNSKQFIEDEPIENWDFNFSEKEAANALYQELNSIKVLSKQMHNTITLFGPKGEFYIGPNTLNKVNSETDGWEEKLIDIILKVQYQLPESESNNILQLSGKNGEDDKIVKVVSDETSYVLKKYDYLIFNKTEKDLILITNDVLNENLPETWELVDEYTIVAPALKSEYPKLVQKLIPFNEMDNL